MTNETAVLALLHLMLSIICFVDEFNQKCSALKGLREISQRNKWKLNSFILWVVHSIKHWFPVFYCEDKIFMDTKFLFFKKKLHVGAIKDLHYLFLGPPPTPPQKKIL